MSTRKQIVFVVGATGSTGASIARALASRPNVFSVKALVRPSSIKRPIVQEFESLGVEIVEGDIVNDSQARLEELLKGADMVISTTVPLQANQQNNLFLAAKNAGVKRVIPSDFGPNASPGVMEYHDQKIRIRQFMKENDIPHTFIQVGFWPSVLLPYPHNIDARGPLGSVFGKQYHGDGKAKIAYTVLENVGEFVARIITDPRTLNKTVQTWDGETTVEELYEVASKVTGENFDDYVRLSSEEIETLAADSQNMIKRAIYQYIRLLIRGENTVEKAVVLGALDARELYPDYSSPSLEQIAMKHYSQPEKIVKEYSLEPDLREDMGISISG